MTPVIRLYGDVADDFREAQRLVGVLNEYLPMLAVTGSGRDHWDALQRMLEAFSADSGERAELCQALPPTAETPLYWYAWDPAFSRFRVATYDRFGRTIWAA